eukprot:7702406-Lingulodinium_polyedra.AAC.1
MLRHLDVGAQYAVQQQGFAPGASVGRRQLCIISEGAWPTRSLVRLRRGRRSSGARRQGRPQRQSS